MTYQRFDVVIMHKSGDEFDNNGFVLAIHPGWYIIYTFTQDDVNYNGWELLEKD